MGVFIRYLLPPGTHKAIFVVLERFEVRIRSIGYILYPILSNPSLPLYE